MRIRPPAVAGSFYPSGKEILKSTIRRFLSEAKPVTLPGKLKAMIVPHSGYEYCGRVAAAGYKLITDHEPKTVVLIGPSHFASFEGGALCDDLAWQTPLGMVKIHNLPKGRMLRYIEAVHQEEHSLEVQIPFLQSILTDFAIAPILTGEVSPQELAEEISLCVDKHTLFIASSDLSHYHPYQEALELDQVASSAIPSLDMKTVAEQVEACGKTAIQTVMHLAQKFGWRGILLDYRNSGDRSGDKRRVVGYGCYGFYQQSA
jgi:AmmeMemoRadiSam system protein B